MSPPGATACKRLSARPWFTRRAPDRPRRAGRARRGRTVASRPVGLERAIRRPANDRQPARLARLADADGRRPRAARRVREASAATASPMSCCSAWAARASRPKCCVPCSASHLAGRAFTCSTRPIRPPCVRVDTPAARTLYILASKSGTTIEPNSLAAHFRSGSKPAASELGRSLRRDHRRRHRAGRSGRARPVPRIFINPSDIGGRYSAFSYLRPRAGGAHGTGRRGARRLGARHARRRSEASADVTTNPAVALGLAMARRRSRGRDKLTLLLPPALEPFGLWVEQLVAESTGKNGVGVVPIAGEPPGHATRTAPIASSSAWHRRRERTGRDARPSRRRRCPVVSIDLPEPAALGAEFVRWEIATAVAGALLGINPFDEPNVQQAKDATATLAARRYKAHRQLPVAGARSNRRLRALRARR